MTPGQYLRDMAAEEINQGRATLAPDSAKIVNAAAWAAMPLIIGAILQKRPSAVTALTSLGMGAIGYSLPSIWNRAVEAGNAGAIESETAELMPKLSAFNWNLFAGRSFKEALKGKAQNLKGYAKNIGRGIAGIPKEVFTPLKTIGGGVGVLGSAGMSAGRDFLRGITMPVTGPMKLSDRALSIGSKALLGYGVYKGGTAIGKRSVDQNNYVKYLRNQVLAGNIKPEEIPGPDIEAIRRLGM